jgi:hypothetical protein
VNAKWQAKLAYACWRLGDVLAMGVPAERAEARGHLERARRILVDLAAGARLTHEEQGWLPQIEGRLRGLPALG